MSTGTILDKIIARKQEEIAVGKNDYTLGDLQSMADNQRIRWVIYSPWQTTSARHVGLLPACSVG